MIYCAFAVLAFVAALSLVPTSESDDWEDYQASEPPRRRKNSHTSHTKYIDAHLHRDDARQARHKQNQWPL